MGLSLHLEGDQRLVQTRHLVGVVQVDSVLLAEPLGVGVVVGVRALVGHSVPLFKHLRYPRSQMEHSFRRVGHGTIRGAGFYLDPSL